MVVECFGKLTFENAPSLKEGVKPLIPQQKRIVLDLQGVPQIDSSGLGTVVGLYVTGRTRGCRIEIMNATQQVSELFSVTNLLSLFEEAGRCAMKPSRPKNCLLRKNDIAPTTPLW